MLLQFAAVRLQRLNPQNPETETLNLRNLRKERRNETIRYETKRTGMKELNSQLLKTTEAPAM